VASVHRLEEHRSGARAERVADEVNRLLAGWSIDPLPRTAVLDRLTYQGRLLTVSPLAASMQDRQVTELLAHELANAFQNELEGARWFSDTEQLLHEDEKPQGGMPVEDPARLATEIVREIGQHPGVLVETRLGVFAFAEVAFQQYLAAIFFASERDVLHLLSVREDPWWHDVIVFAAGLGAPFSSRLPPKTLVRALLDATVTANSVTTFLAARCAEAASYLPTPIRTEIERRLAAAVPPRSNIQVAHLVDDIGAIAAPALVAALGTAGANERAFLVTALGRLDYPPAVRVLARLVGDDDATTEPIVCWAWKVDAIAMGLPVGFCAFAAFFNLAFSTPSAYAMFNEVLDRASHATLDAFIRLIVQKLMNDEHWGADAELERDPDRIALLIDKVVTASERGGAR